MPPRGRPTVPGLRSQVSLSTTVKPARLGGRVVLVDDGAEPLDHGPLHVRRARRGGVDHPAQRRHVVAGPHRLGQVQHAHEVGGHEEGVGDAVALDGGQRGLGIEALQRGPRCRRWPDSPGTIPSGRRGTAAPESRNTVSSVTPYWLCMSSSQLLKVPNGASGSGRLMALG